MIFYRSNNSLLDVPLYRKVLIIPELLFPLVLTNGQFLLKMYTVVYTIVYRCSLILTLKLNITASELK